MILVKHKELGELKIRGNMAGCFQDDSPALLFADQKLAEDFLVTVVIEQSTTHKLSDFEFEEAERA